MKLTNNFHLEELISSDTAARKGISNEPEREHLVAMTALTLNVLQPVRDEHGIVTVTSGYRSKDLNEAIGGSSNSQHCKGEAADFKCYAISNVDLAKWIEASLTFDQLSLEFYKKGDPRAGWIHCSYSRFNNRRKTMTASMTAKGVKYENGLVV